MTIKIVDGLAKLSNGGFVPVKINSMILWNKMMKDISKNNTWCPDIVRIIYNTKTWDWKRDENGHPIHDSNCKKIKVDLDNPILATTVEFNDNTKVTVTNSRNDRINLVKDEETGAIVASEADKEAGLVYAIVKKLIGTPDAKGTVNGDGFGRILREFVSSAWDQNLEEKRSEINKANAHAKHLEIQKNAKPKAKRMSLAQAMDRLGEALKEIEDLKAKVNGSSSNVKSGYKKLWAKKLTSLRLRDSHGRFI